MSAVLHRALFVFACAAAVLPAQVEGPAELQRAQRSLQQSRTDLDRLIEMRLRHDLGLVPARELDAAERTFRPPTPPTSEAIERMNVELEAETNAAQSLRDKYEKLRSAVDQLRAEAEAKTRDEAAQQPFLTLPPAGRAPTTLQGGPAAVGGAQPSGANQGATPPTPSAPAGETAPVADPVALDPALDPLRAQIHGSTDHRRVAQALFRAGQALIDRAAAAREQHQDVVARQLDDRGKDRLERALAELQPLLKEKEPPLEALFYQGKILELLFRHAERNLGLSPATNARDWERREQEVRDPFLRITARDVNKTGPRGETEVLGPWGKAAQTALEHFRWMNLNAGYDANPVIDGLTWPGEKDQ